MNFIECCGEPATIAKGSCRYRVDAFSSMFPAAYNINIYIVTIYIYLLIHMEKKYFFSYSFLNTNKNILLFYRRMYFPKHRVVVSFKRFFNDYSNLTAATMICGIVAGCSGLILE